MKATAHRGLIYNLEDMLPRLRLNTPVRLIHYEASGNIYSYPTRIGRILMRAGVELDDWSGSLELALWEAVELIGIRNDAQCYVKRVS